MQPHDTTPPLKTCTKCGESKPNTSEYFYISKTGRDGLYCWCIVCALEYNKEYRRKRKADQYHAWYEANKVDAAEYNHAWYEAHKEERLRRAREINRIWREANKEYRKAYRKARSGRAVELGREWRKKNPERHRETRLALYAKNKERDNQRLRVKEQRRRARKRNAEGTHTAADIQTQYKRQKGKCYYCGKKTGDDYHIEHIVPLSRGGTNWPDNIVIACSACNLSKANKLPHEWPEGGRLL